MPDISEQLANIRYTLYEAVTQADKVTPTSLDLETIQLNLRDLREQLNVACSELDDACNAIETSLQEVNDES